MLVATIKSGGLVTLPDEVLEHLHLKEGDRIEFRIGENGAVWIRPAADEPKSHSILELCGLGKELWDGIDPVEYIRAERDSWDS
ncbi:MAG TPA: AbrB/MazE/SpoVT family DNA-binding domain-containing protein [Thermoanaerobaculia bacterium]|jgi:bifunctional DNA-binding transcriptional regulator/antitoxin component of YhaV-PrlF toxin-antitoxin module|nr:AbrB/MazE/SpoVT family DNA-binding domain-containing protein [Thermoanaerobaculia bacterium]